MHRASFNQPYANGGRSPYAVYAQTPANNHNLSELYDYVDEEHNILTPSTSRYPQTFEEDDAPDVIHINYRGDSWPIEFPPFSIAEEKVTVGHVRDRVALRLDLKGQEGRVKLLYKDHELRVNKRPLRRYGCKQNSEITVIKLTEPRDYNRAKHDSGSDSDSVVSYRSRMEENPPRRSMSAYRRRDPEPRPNYPSSNGHLHPHGTPPTGNTPPRQQSPIRPSNPSYAQRAPRQPSPSARRPSPPTPTAPAVQPPQADPSTDLGKIQSMRYEFHSQWMPAIQAFIRSPPPERDDREKEYRRLSEIAYKRVFEPGDAMEPDGPDKEEIRATRKKLYKEAGDILKELDRFKPKESKH